MSQKPRPNFFRMGNSRLNNPLVRALAERKISVMLNDFTPTGVSQLNLFDEVQPRACSSELMKFLDGINHS